MEFIPKFRVFSGRIKFWITVYGYFKSIQALKSNRFSGIGAEVSKLGYPDGA